MTPWLAPVLVEKRFPLPFPGSAGASRPSPAAHPGVEPPKHSTSEEGPCSDRGSAFLRHDSVPRNARCPGGRGWRHATQTRRVCFPGCRGRAELMAVLCRAGVIFWEEGGPKECDRPRKRLRKLPLLNSHPCWERGSREMSPGHADLPWEFPQPLTVSMLRGAPAERSLSQWDHWDWGTSFARDQTLAQKCLAVLSLLWLQNLWMLWGLVAPLPGLVP